MSFTVDTNHQALFGGDFYGQVKISTSRNVENNTYTVTVEGARGYSKYEWNFGQRVQVWLATTSSGTGKVQPSYPPSGYISIPSSGSGSYKGWVPKSGYDTGCKITKTFNGKSDGSCPEVWLYFRDYNPGILWVNQGNNVSLDVSVKKNISSSVQSDSGGPNDVALPKVSLAINEVKSSSIKFTATSDVDCDAWQYKLDSGSWKTFHSSSCKTKTFTIEDVSSVSHKLQIAAQKVSNNKWGYTTTATVDCSLPVIESFSIVPTSNTEATARFYVNRDFQYKLTNPNNEGQTSWSGTKSGKTNHTHNITTVQGGTNKYTLTVRRSDATGITASKVITYETEIPQIKNLSIVAESSTSVRLIFNIQTGYAYQWRIKCPGKDYTSWSSLYSSGTSVNSLVTTTETYDNYTLQVRRSGERTSICTEKTVKVDTRLPKITNFTLVPFTDLISGVQNAYLSFTTDMKCSYEFLSSVGTDGDDTGTTSVDDTVVPIHVNSLNTCTLRVSRIDNPKLTSSQTKTVNTIRPTLVIDSVSIQGVTLSIAAKSTDTNVKNWAFTFKDAATREIVKTEEFDATTTKNTQFTRSLTGTEFLIPGHKYIIEVYAENVDNSLGSTVAWDDEIILGGTVRVFHNKSIACAVPYVYMGGSWQQIIPYIWKNGDWEMTL